MVGTLITLVWESRGENKRLKGENQENLEDFPGGSVVRTPPVNAGDPCLGRSHVPWGKYAHMLLPPKRMCPRAHAPQQEKPPQ